MVEYLLDEYLEFSFGTQTPATGAAVDADALPTYRVYEENNDVAVDTGNCAKRDDAGTLGYYCARAQITTVAGYEVGKDYYVEAIAIVGGVTSPPIPIGMFRVVPADVARDDQWTDARADYIDGLDALVIDEVSIGVMANRFDFLYGTPNRDVDNFKYAVCVFTSGGLIGQARTVTGSTAGGGAMFPISLLFATPFTDTPGAGDEFVLWPAASLLVGDEMDIVDAPNATAIAAIQAGLALEVTLTAIKGVGWTSAESLKAIKDAIDAIGPGEGANVVDVTLNDGAGDPADGVIAVARLVGGTLARGTGTTGAGGTTGEVQFQLDDGTYEVTFGPSATYSFANPYVLVVSGATVETFVCTLLVMPTPSAPELCVCYADLRYVDGGQLIGAEEGYLQVIAVTDDPHVWPPLATQAALAVDDVLYQTDASGRAQFEAVRSAVITVRVVRPWGYGANLHEEQVTFTVPDEAAYWIPGAHS